jgi:polar amino acid transport system substrate-binding protein
MVNQEMRNVVLVADLYPPYQFEEGGTVRGVDHEIIFEAFKIYDIDTETKLFTWEECMAQMEDHRVDGIFQITCNSERQEKFLFSDILRISKTAFFSREANSLVFNPDVDIAKQLQGLRIGVLSGYSYDVDIDRLSDESKLKVERAAQLLQGLVRGEFDVALLDIGVASYLIKKHNVKGIVKNEGYEIERILYVAFQKELAGLVDIFNSGLNKIKQNGLYDEILYKYGM